MLYVPSNDVRSLKPGRSAIQKLLTSCSLWYIFFMHCRILSLCSRSFMSCQNSLHDGCFVVTHCFVYEAPRNAHIWAENCKKRALSPVELYGACYGIAYETGFSSSTAGIGVVLLNIAMTVPFNLSLIPFSIAFGEKVLDFHDLLSLVHYFILTLCSSMRANCFWPFSTIYSLKKIALVSLCWLVWGRVRTYNFWKVINDAGYVPVPRGGYA